MRVLIVGFTKIVYMPYLKFYIDQLLESDSDISLIYWDRDSNLDEPLPDRINSYCYKGHMSDSEPIIKKIPYFIKFRKHAIKVMGNDKFDLVIVLHSIPAVLLSDVLINQYPNRYIFDYRDYTYESHIVFKRIIKSLFNHSIMNFVSSEGYLKYLPEINNKYISHNLSLDVSGERLELKHLDIENKVIRIRYWGMIRHETINKQIISKLGNDLRFELHYHGRVQKDGLNLKQFVMDNKYENVYFHGEYRPSERSEFAKQTDILLNIYENDTKTKFAMGNKYYDGLSYYLPQLCNRESFMGMKAEQAGIGLMLSPEDDDFAESVYNYFKTLELDKFYEQCDKEYDSICEEYIRGSTIIKDILSRERL